MKAVFDTNVFVGACLGVGPANYAIQACIEGRVTPVMGTALFREYEDVLGRVKIFEGSLLDIAERERLLDIFAARCVWSRIYFGWRPNLRDEGDNHLIELAVAGDCQTIVTRNKRDFFQMELQFPDIRILDPAELLEVISA
ncbi:putative toxin-antitoxin system toxin component, PIN family [Thioalkalivibrio sp. AKL12]|uniref:putative toxin-antitoxin system toxin component, PIN family n=1 Tax=Thioalkalivibrio sp. AKL12 TaxID=1158159 RepID=UPI000476AF2E|nr:putative toxin-antitoxin system toxin component, PIN family [Thioalkalivibrio sp. AKL12]